MKKTLLVLALAAVLVFAFATTASAKYAGYSATKAYLPWADANTIYDSLNGTTSGQDASPHGGYTQTSVKCVVCHSTHRAYSNVTTTTYADTGSLVGIDYSLLNGAGGSCLACHTAWGASPSAALVEFAEVGAGPHIGSGCTYRGCHGSVHGTGTPSKYAVAVKYNLTNGTLGLLDAQMDAAIAGGNVNAEINTTSTHKAMKAYVTGYVCFPCHGNSSFSVATRGAANLITYSGAEVYASGHPSAGIGNYSPSCESCHDMIGVATGTTAFPHGNRNIEVYEGRFDHYNQVPDTGAVVAGSETLRYNLWMTSADYSDDHSTYKTAAPIAGANFSLADGVCIKCHNPIGLK